MFLLYEDFKVDFLFENCFYVEMYFSFGVKIMDDFEFLVRNFFIRKCSVEDVRYVGVSKFVYGINVGIVGKIS